MDRLRIAKRAGLPALIALGLALAGSGAKAQVVYGGGGYQLGGNAYSFGNGFNKQPTHTLFCAAGPDDENHGVYGAIRFAPKPDE